MDKLKLWQTTTDIQRRSQTYIFDKLTRQPQVYKGDLRPISLTSWPDNHRYTKEISDLYLWQVDQTTTDIQRRSQTYIFDKLTRQPQIYKGDLRPISLTSCPENHRYTKEISDLYLWQVDQTTTGIQRRSQTYIFDKLTRQPQIYKGDLRPISLTSWPDNHRYTKEISDLYLWQVVQTTTDIQRRSQTYIFDKLSR